MLKILIVDDEASRRTTLADILGQDGYKVIEAADEEEALDKVRETKPDLVLYEKCLYH